MKTPRRLWVLLALALGGFGVSISQSQHFYQLRSGLGSFKSFCTTGDTFNCDVVGASRYAELIAGIPLSSFAAGWYLALLVVLWMARDAFWRRDALRASTLMTGWGALMSLVYFGVMSLLLHTFCMMCLVVDAINWVSFGIVLSFRSEVFNKSKSDQQKFKLFCGIALASLLVMVVILKSLDPLTLSRSQREELLNRALTGGAQNVESGPEFPANGRPDAPITIVEFADYQCPHCRIGARSVHFLPKLSGDRVRVIYKAFPMGPTCNRMIRNGGHPAACESARVVWCANQQGKFMEAHEALFEHQESLEQPSGIAGLSRPAELAVKSGVDRAKLEACLASPEASAAISRDVEEALRLGIKGTPTFFINGRMVEGGLPTPLWLELINKF